MSDYYVIDDCPKCQSNCYKKIGGYHGLPFEYVCVICGTTTTRALRAAFLSDHNLPATAEHA
jgi:hypothetical protein